MQENNSPLRGQPCRLGVHLYTQALAPIWQPFVGVATVAMLHSPDPRLTRIAGMHGAICHHTSADSKCSMIGATRTGKLAAWDPVRKVI